MKDPSRPADPLPAELVVADAIGKLMHFWGFKRPMGRIWTLLYLSKDPLTAADLGEQLHMSSGAISMALGELEKWGAITRTWVPGERRDFFTAETSVWTMVRRVLRERELSIVRDFRAALSSAIAALEADASCAEPKQPGPAYRLARLRDLERLAKTGETLLAALVAGGIVDPNVLSEPKPPAPPLS